jgi:hypothetical protein
MTVKMMAVSLTLAVAGIWKVKKPCPVAVRARLVYETT